MNNEINKTYTGTVDDFLNHCSKLDFDISDEEYANQEYERCLAEIMKTLSLNREEAIEYYEFLLLENLKETLEQMEQDGLVEIHDYDESGEPRFVLTKLGQACANELVSQEATTPKPKKKTKKKKK